MIPSSIQPFVSTLVNIFSGTPGFVWTLLLIGALTGQVLMEAYGHARPLPWVRVLRIITIVLLVAFSLNVALRFAQIIQLSTT